MTRVLSWVMVMIALVLAIFVGRAISAQDKYNVKVPGGLAFSEFRGYEGWQAISISRNERVVAMILGNHFPGCAFNVGVTRDLSDKRMCRQNIYG